MQMDEFCERLVHGERLDRCEPRPCDNEDELEHVDELKQFIEKDIREKHQIHSTYYRDYLKILRDKPRPPSYEKLKRTSRVRSKLKEHLKMPQQYSDYVEWDKHIRDLIPKDAFEPINLSEYCSLMKQKYSELYPYGPKP